MSSTSPNSPIEMVDDDARGLQHALAFAVGMLR